MEIMSNEMKKTFVISGLIVCITIMTAVFISLFFIKDEPKMHGSFYELEQTREDKKNNSAGALVSISDSVGFLSSKEANNNSLMFSCIENEFHLVLFHTFKTDRRVSRVFITMNGKEPEETIWYTYDDEGFSRALRSKDLIERIVKNDIQTFSLAIQDKYNDPYIMSFNVSNSRKGLAKVLKACHFKN